MGLIESWSKYLSREYLFNVGVEKKQDLAFSQPLLVIGGKKKAGSSFSPTHKSMYFSFDYKWHRLIVLLLLSLFGDTLTDLLYQIFWDTNIQNLTNSLILLIKG